MACPHLPSSEMQVCVTNMPVGHAHLTLWEFIGCLLRRGWAFPSNWLIGLSVFFVPGRGSTSMFRDSP